ncbi:MAG: ubiquitin-conjugating enzyme E2 [Candidatus Helarchaeota archaeon]
MSDQLDYILAKEAELLYKRAKEFEPVGGNLKIWRGSIPGRGEYKNVNFEIEIRIPDTFPREPPTVIMITPTEHPKVDEKTGKVDLRILTYWRPNYHVYQIINSIKGLYARIPPKLAEPSRARAPQIAATTSAPQSTAPVQYTPSSKEEKLEKEVKRLEQELASLRENITVKDEKLAHLRGQLDVHNVPEEGMSNLESILLPSNPIEKQILDLESEKIAIEDLLQTLEEKFDNAEIGSGEYSRLYKKYMKTLYLINKKLEELKSKQ